MKVKELIREIVADEEDDYCPSIGQRIWHFVKLYVCFLILTALFQLVYIEIGHDKGWQHAERWYNCIHK